MACCCALIQNFSVFAGIYTELDRTRLPADMQSIGINNDIYARYMEVKNNVRKKRS